MKETGSQVNILCSVVFSLSKSLKFKVKSGLIWSDLVGVGEFERWSDGVMDCRMTAELSLFDHFPEVFE